MAQRRSLFYLSLKAKFFLFTICSGVILAILAYQIENVLHYVRPLSAKEAVFPYNPQKTWALSERLSSDRIEPFSIDVSEETLADLRYRLQHTRFGSELPGVNFEYGFPSKYLREVVDYWLNRYSWKEQENAINQYDHFKTKIEGLNIHFVRVSPAKNDDVRIYPIILLHGWPGSFYELYKLIPLLTKPRANSCGHNVAFEVIIPSLPGYGFSDAAQRPGLDTAAMARIFHHLMTRLKFDKYFIHGGDWGSFIGRLMATMYPKSVLGLELTMYPIPMLPSLIKSAVASFIPSWFVDHHESDKLFFHNIQSILRETGYMHIQATKPDTVGAALSDSPAGLAAYIMEKFSTWTNDENIQHPQGNLPKYFSMDDLINNVMIYWISNSIMTSQRLYKEVLSSPDYDTYLRYPVEVPTVLSDFRHELRGGNPPTEYVRPYFSNLLKVSSHEIGGHFPAMERPGDIAEDIWTLGLTVMRC